LIAALYDIHGNLPALDAVLAEVDADVIVVGGDFVAGPWPAETLERLRSLDGDVRFIRGNADRELVDEEQGLAPPAMMEFVRARLSEEQLDFLRSLPLTETIGRTLFCHATPRDDEEIFTAITPAEVVEPMLAAAEPTVVCGHTHVQFDRTIGGRRVVNAGSVGLPYEGQTGARWCLLGPDVQLRRTDYDMEAAAERISATDLPEAAELAQETLEPAAAEEATAHFEKMRIGRE